MMRGVVITGMGIEIPGLEQTSDLVKLAGDPIALVPFDPKKKLGKKGLLAKDQATKLALSATKSALEDAKLPVTADEQRSPETLGVTVGSNLGNLDTIAKVVDEIHQGHVRDTSIMDAPNASSNVIASTIAIRFGCRAPNLMFTSGAGTGAEALYFAANAIRAGRAERMIVVGVEPSNAVCTRLMEASVKSWLGEVPSGFRIPDAAGAVVLESEESARARSASIRGRLAGFGRGDDIAASVDVALAGLGATPKIWFVPGRAYAPVGAAVNKMLAALDPATEVIDLWPALGELYGALGVVECVAGCARLASGSPHDSFLATSGATFGDGAYTFVVTR